MTWADLTNEQRKANSKKVAANLLAKDPDYYRKIGAKGGSRKSSSKGFGSMDKGKHIAASIKGGHNKPLTGANGSSKIEA